MKRVSLKALDAPLRAKASGYPERFLARVAGREKRPLGDLFDLTKFGDAHHLVNRTKADVLYLEVGDRTRGDGASYPDDDLQAVQDAAGKWRFLHKDGTTY